MRLTLDYETRSECELRNCGGSEYARHPSTEIICLGYKIEDEPAKLWFPILGDRMPAELLTALCNPEFIRVAHNAFFEQSISHFVLPKYCEETPVLLRHLRFNPNRWKCTAAKARASAFPGKLEQAVLAARLPYEKDMVGHRLMLQMCKPKKSWKLKGTGPKYVEDPERLERLGAYCLADVEAEYALDNYFPDLSPSEREVWLMDQRMNWHGVHVDRESCRKILDMIEAETLQLKEETSELTLGIVLSATQRNEILDFVESEGLKLPDLRAGTVKKALLEQDMSDVARRLLEIRQAVSRTSTAKYKRFLDRSNRDDARARDLLVYHGPSTGRWAGSGIQPQNFPRGTVKDTGLAINVIADADLELVRLCYEDPMLTFSSCLRGMITATPGKTLFVADYNAIETRVLWFLADNQEGLRLYREGLDPYCEMASKVFKRTVTKKDFDARQLGKKLVLGAGYGLGWKKFKMSCEQDGMDGITDKLAAEAISAYREFNFPVTQLWSNLERASVLACMKKKRVSVNRTTWFMEGPHLICVLPSGRRLTYPFATVKGMTTPWGEVKPGLHYFGVNSFTRKWTEETTYGGKIAENITQAVARDCMVEGMKNASRAGYEILLTVHDEIVSEKETGSVQEFEELITTMPEWGKDIPLLAEGWSGTRYRK